MIVIDTYDSNKIRKQDCGLRKEKVLLVFKVGRDLSKALYSVFITIILFLNYQN